MEMRRKVKVEAKVKEEQRSADLCLISTLTSTFPYEER